MTASVKASPRIVGFHAFRNHIEGQKRGAEVVPIIKTRRGKSKRL
jgi:hypothetical protein